MSFAGKSAAELEQTPVFQFVSNDAERVHYAGIIFTLRAVEMHDCEFYSFFRWLNGSNLDELPPLFLIQGKLMGMVVTGRPVGGLRRAYRSLAAGA